MNYNFDAHPNFLIIGSMKCGTTSLHDYLGKHPDIYSTTPKEIHFFTEETYDSSKLDDYLSYFRSIKEVAGTSPQNYTKRHRKEFSGVPERLYNHLPEIKLIYIVRDPLDRIISHYNEAQEGGYAPIEGLNSYLKDYRNNHYVKTSMYFYQLEAYLKYFPLNQIIVVESEELMKNRLETLNKIFEFLGVDMLTDESHFSYKANTSTHKLRRNVIGNIIFESKLNTLKTIIPGKFREKIRNNNITRKLTRTSIVKETIHPELEQKIRAFLKEDVDKLRMLTGQKFKSWSI